MLAVIDTNVVFEGLTKQGGASRLVVDAWLACFSRAFQRRWYTNTEAY